MPAPYSNDMRCKVLEAYQNGEGSVEEVASNFGVSTSFVDRLLKRYRETKSVIPKPHGQGHPPAFTEEHICVLHSHLQNHPDATLNELRAVCGVDCSLETVSQTLKRLGITRKKTLRASEQDREDVQEERKTYQEDMQVIDINRLVFLDESGAKTNMTRSYAWSPKGERAYGCAPYGHWQTTTMIGSVRWDGQTTCMTLDGAVDSEAFVIYIKEVLGPTLQAGDLVLMDNLSSHKPSKVVQAIESFGAQVRYLPRYSPDFNPIEMMWSKIKQFLKDAKARTEEALIQSIGKAFQDVKPCHAFGWFKKCGYLAT